MALWPWKFKNPAGLPMALTEATKAFRLQELQRAHAVPAWTRTFTLCPKMMLPGFCGSGNGSYSMAVSMNSSWRAEQAYSHQNRLRLIAQTSHPPPCSPKIPSICLKFLRVVQSLQRLQQPSLPGEIQSLQAESSPNSKGSLSTWKGRKSGPRSYLHLEWAQEITKVKRRRQSRIFVLYMLIQIILLIILNIIHHQSIDSRFLYWRTTQLNFEGEQKYQLMNISPYEQIKYNSMNQHQLQRAKQITQQQ